MKEEAAGLRLAICIQTDDPDLLTPRMIYQVMPDGDASKSEYVRVIDNEGEDYLYPSNYFLFVDFPSDVQRALVDIPQPHVTR